MEHKGNRRKVKTMFPRQLALCHGCKKAIYQRHTGDGYYFWCDVGTTQIHICKGQDVEEQAERVREKSRL